MNSVDHQGAASIVPTPKEIECRKCGIEVHIEKDSWGFIKEEWKYLLVCEDCLILGNLIIPRRMQK